MKVVNSKLMKVIIIFLALIEISSVYLMYKTYQNKEVKLDTVSLLDKVEVPEMFAIMLEQSDGTYAESNSSDWPSSDEYIYDSEQSGCIDASGNRLNDILSYDVNTNIATVETGNTSYCYLYFRKPTNLYELCNGLGTDECISKRNNNISNISDIWDSTLEEDGYRYVGTNPDNYICFGTESEEECKNDTDKYMYRIIGIFEDESGKQHLKLIKKEALNTSYAWHSDGTTDTNWQDSDLYKGINGSYFLSNTSYSYMQDTSWNSLIEIWNYTATNTLSYENYSTNSVYGPHYYYTSTRAIYLHELNRSGKSGQTCYYNSSTTVDCTVGEWKKTSEWDKSVIAEPKIGLMYASDYALSLGETSLDYTSYSNYSILKTGWMHLSNNDSATLSTTAVAPPSDLEWTMSRYGANSNGHYVAFYVSSSGVVGWYGVDVTSSVRPVFYLTSDSVLSGGNGTSSNPYTIDTSPNLNEFCSEYSNINECIEKEENNIEEVNDLWDSTLEDDGIRYVGTNSNNYVCFGTTDTNTCTSDTDKYMYRIIGIFEDEDGKQHLKLIKKEALNTGYAWDSTYTSEIEWADSDVYNGINGSYFLTNTSYPYMQDTTWTNKIYNWTYTATNTKTYENYSTTGTPYGPYYYYNTGQSLYLHELNRSGKSSETCYYNSNTTADCTVGTWTSVPSKIGLMYVSDYTLSLGESVLDYRVNSYYSTLKTGWVHLSNNDSATLSTTAADPPATHEWTITRYGLNGYYRAWVVHSDGGVSWSGVHNMHSVRPVFYLTENIRITSGKGSITEPFIIS